MIESSLVRSPEDYHSRALLRDLAGDDSLETMHPTEAPPAERADTLALLYQNMLTAVVRIQAGRQQLGDLDTFRRRMKSALQDVEREAGLAGYASTDIRDAAFAVVALLDETILSSNESKAEEWRKQPLNVELFGQTRAGDVFFDKLSEIERRHDSPQVADLLEVFLLCLLLGFEGRLAPPLRGEAHRITERLRARIETIRKIDYKLAPVMEFRPEPVAAAPKSDRTWLWWILGAAAAVLLLFLIYRLNLSSWVDRLESLNLTQLRLGAS